MNNIFHISLPCKNIETIPKIKIVKDLTVERLRFIHQCLEVYANTRVENLEVPKHGDELLESVLYDMKKNNIYKNVGDIYLNNLSKKQINELYEISIKNFPKVKFLYWFFHHNPDIMV